MKYAESQGADPFDWNQYLLDKIAGVEQPINPFTKAIIQDEDAKHLASEWVTCAVGNTCDALPRKVDDNDHSIKGQPLDTKLLNWGVQFADDIDEEDWWGAQKTLAKIEKRSTKLLIKMGVICPTTNTYMPDDPSTAEPA